MPPGPAEEPRDACGAFSSMDLEPILAKSIDGRLLTEEEATLLLRLPPAQREPVRDAADRLRADLVGDRVTYVFNRNINFTNACTSACLFCAYRVEPGSPDETVMTPEDVVRLATATPGIDEVCMVGGLNPRVTFDQVLALIAAIHDALPEVHVHALSPMEIDYYASRAGLSIREAFAKLVEAGYGSLCGTAAEVLVDEVRRVICPAKLSTARWVEVVRTAHAMGLRSTSTMLFGHIETPEHTARHLGVLRDLQAATGGFTEYIALPFVPYRTPLARTHGVTRMIATEDVLHHYAVARLFFGRLIPNIQSSWCKLGLEAATAAFARGVNDLGGTLLSESITRSAGGTHGESLTLEAMTDAIRRAGRTPVRRDTLYHLLDAPVETR